MLILKDSGRKRNPAQASVRLCVDKPVLSIYSHSLKEIKLVVFKHRRFSLFLEDQFFQILIVWYTGWERKYTRPLVFRCIVDESLNKAIGIINFAKPFLNFIDDTMIWFLNSKLDFNPSCAKDFRNLISMVIWCINWRRLLALIFFQPSLFVLVFHIEKLWARIDVVFDGLNRFFIRKSPVLAKITHNLWTENRQTGRFH